MSTATQAAVTLPAVLSDHAVLNRSEQVPIWGWAKPGEVVTVQFDQLTLQTTANAQGKWRVNLNLTQSKAGPFELKVAGSNQITVKDVVVGEVWLASGQSNMEFKVGNTIEAPEEFARPPNPNVREFKVARNTSVDPLDDCVGKWEIASPTTLGEFSAIGDEFAKEIAAHQRAPVGILHSAWGGMNIERWIGAKGFTLDAALNLRAIDLVNQTRQSIADVAAFDSALRAWQTQYAREDTRIAKTADFAAPGVSSADWKPVTLPGELGIQGLPDAGAIWLRRTVHFDSVVDSTQFNIGFPVGFVDVY